MSTPTFAKTYNLIAYLEKPVESKGFKQIIDFLNGSSVKESFIRRTLRLDDAEGTSCLTNAEIFEGLARMGYEKPSDKLTFYKAFFSPQWKFLIHTILRCLTPEGVDILQSDAESIPIPAEPSTYKPQKKHNLKRKHTREPEELMDFCTNLSNKVLDLENGMIDIKSTYQARIAKLESMVERLKEENRVLKELKSVHFKVDSDEPVMEIEKSSKQGRK
nr:hypothetical protein [Tanacetum cinerariifolium]